MRLWRKIVDSLSPNTAATDDNVDDDGYDEEYGEQLLGEEEWEDAVQAHGYMEQYPGWKAVKIVDFGTDKLRLIDEWLGNHCQKPHKRIGWRSGCAYTTGVMFEDTSDAILFKLRWR